MAEIYPFTGFRFAQATTLTEEKKVTDLFLKNFDGSRFDLLIKEKILIEDRIPSIYVYFQIFFDITQQERVTKGFICNLKLSDWDQGNVLRHEHVNFDSVQLQKSVLENGRVFTNPIHGMYCDIHSELNHYMNESILNPLIDFVDNGAIRHVLSVIHDKKVILKFLEVIKDKKITIADGHHRFTAALEKMKDDNIEPFIPAFLTNTSHNNISVVAYHRLLKFNENNEEQILLKLRKSFKITETEINSIENKLLENKNTIGFIISGKAFLGERLLSDYTNILDTNKFMEDLSDQIKNPNLLNITYESNIKIVSQLCTEGKYNLGIVLRSYTADEIIELSMKGERLPEKSTCFYPKVLNGIVILPIEQQGKGLKKSCYDE